MTNNIFEDDYNNIDKFVKTAPEEIEDNTNLPGRLLALSTSAVDNFLTGGIAGEGAKAITTMLNPSIGKNWDEFDKAYKNYQAIGSGLGTVASLISPTAKAGNAIKLGRLGLLKNGGKNAVDFTRNLFDKVNNVADLLPFKPVDAKNIVAKLGNTLTKESINNIAPAVLHAVNEKLQGRSPTASDIATDIFSSALIGMGANKLGKFAGKKLQNFVEDKIADDLGLSKELKKFTGNRDFKEQDIISTKAKEQVKKLAEGDIKKDIDDSFKSYDEFSKRIFDKSDRIKFDDIVSNFEKKLDGFDDNVKKEYVQTFRNYLNNQVNSHSSQNDTPIPGVGKIDKIDNVEVPQSIKPDSNLKPDTIDEVSRADELLQEYLPPKPDVPKIDSDIDLQNFIGNKNITKDEVRGAIDYYSGVYTDSLKNKNSGKYLYALKNLKALDDYLNTNNHGIHPQIIKDNVKDLIKGKDELLNLHSKTPYNEYYDDSSNKDYIAENNLIKSLNLYNSKKPIDPENISLDINDYFNNKKIDLKDPKTQDNFFNLLNSLSNYNKTNSYSFSPNSDASLFDTLIPHLNYIAKNTDNPDFKKRMSSFAKLITGKRAHVDNPNFPFQQIPDVDTNSLNDIYSNIDNKLVKSSHPPLDLSQEEINLYKLTPGNSKLIPPPFEDYISSLNENEKAIFDTLKNYAYDSANFKNYKKFQQNPIPTPEPIDIPKQDIPTPEPNQASSDKVKYADNQALNSLLTKLDSGEFYNVDKIALDHMKSVVEKALDDNVRKYTSENKDWVKGYLNKIPFNYIKPEDIEANGINALRENTAFFNHMFTNSKSDKLPFGVTNSTQDLYFKGLHEYLQNPENRKNILKFGKELENKKSSQNVIDIIGRFEAGEKLNPEDIKSIKQSQQDITKIYNDLSDKNYELEAMKNFVADHLISKGYTQLNRQQIQDTAFSIMSNPEKFSKYKNGVAKNYFARAKELDNIKTEKLKAIAILSNVNQNMLELFDDTSKSKSIINKLVNSSPKAMKKFLDVKNNSALLKSTGKNIVELDKINQLLAGDTPSSKQDMLLNYLTRLNSDSLISQKDLFADKFSETKKALQKNLIPDYENKIKNFANSPYNILGDGIYYDEKGKPYMIVSKRKSS